MRKMDPVASHDACLNTFESCIVRSQKCELGGELPRSFHCQCSSKLEAACSVGAWCGESDGKDDGREDKDDDRWHETGTNRAMGRVEDGILRVKKKEKGGGREEELVAVNNEKRNEAEVKESPRQLELARGECGRGSHIQVPANGCL